MKNQFEVFAAVESNFANAIKATNTAMDSQGSAMKENEKQSESFKVKIQQLKTEFETLVLGKGGLGNFLKGVIDGGIALLKFANGTGQVETKIALLIGAITILNKGFNEIVGSVSNVVARVTAYSVQAGVATVSTATFTAGLKAFTLQWLASPFGIITLGVGAVFGIAKAVDYFTESINEAKDSIEQFNSQYDKSESDTEGINNQLEILKNQIDEINGKENLTLTDQQELDLLKEETEQLQLQAQIEEERRKFLQNEATEKANKTVYADVGVQWIEGEYKDSNRLEFLNDYSKVIPDLQEKLDDLISKQKELESQGDFNSDTYKKNEEDIKDLSDSISNLTQKGLDYVEELKQETDIIDENEQVKKDVNKATKTFIESLNDENNSLDANSESTNDNSEAIRQQVEELSISEDELKEIEEQLQKNNDAYSEAVSAVGNLDDAYGTLITSMDEYNSTGGFSLDTIEDLLSLGGEYLSLLDFENGQVSINEQRLYALANAKIDEAEATAIQKAEYEMFNPVVQDLANSETSVGNAGYGAVGGLDASTSAIVQLGVEASNSKINIQELYNALLQRQGNVASNFNSRNQEITKGLANQINALENLRANIGKSFTATRNEARGLDKNTKSHRDNSRARKGNTDATKSQTKALKEQKKALEDEAKAIEKELKDYKTVIDYVKDLIKEEQEAIESQKDAELKAIQEKIDALKNEQDEFEDNIESQVDTLEKQKEEQEEYWDAQIDAIKNTNEALEDNIKLQQLQEAVARAKSQKVKVLKNGKFVYTEDEEAVSKAQQELADYEQQSAVQRQIKELEKLKEEALNSLDNQINDLNDYREKAKDNYQEQLKDLQDHYDKLEAEYNMRLAQYDLYLKQFDDMLNASAKEHARILYNELVGEQGNWNSRIDALSKFVQNYDAKKSQLDGIKNQINSITNQISGLESRARSVQGNVNNIGGEVQGKLGEIQQMNAQAEAMKPRIKGYRGYVYVDGKQAYETELQEQMGMAKHYADIYATNWKKNHPDANTNFFASPEYYAKGVYSVPDDQIAVVADPLKPSNREIVVGAKLNKGEGIMTNLKKGSGVIPHGRSFTENLINLSRWANNGGIEKVSNVNNSSSSNTVIVENINLPNVSDGESFANYLRTNFVNDTIQYANRRV